MISSRFYFGFQTPTQQEIYQMCVLTYKLDSNLSIITNGFRPKLDAMRGMHGGVKFYIDVQCLMVKYLDDAEITRDTRWVASQLMQANNKAELDKKVGP
eukprot:SAG22_NODE_695_length_7843_cov_2.924587_8_plen_99_part_00